VGSIPTPGTLSLEWSRRVYNLSESPRMNQLRSIGLALAVLVVLAQLQLDAQARPDFSGSWVLSEGSGPACGKSITATQDAATLSLQSDRTVIYKFDGSDTIEAVTPAPPRPADASPDAWFAHAVAGVSRAAWNGDQFIIVTHRTMRMTWPRMMPDAFDRLHTFQQTLTLNADGRLIIDRLAILDPLPGGTTKRLDIPMSLTCTYKRAL
jgi:hypothetical protein